MYWLKFYFQAFYKALFLIVMFLLFWLCPQYWIDIQIFLAFLLSVERRSYLKCYIPILCLLYPPSYCLLNFLLPQLSELFRSNWFIIFGVCFISAHFLAQFKTYNYKFKIFCFVENFWTNEQITDTDNFLLFLLTLSTGTTFKGHVFAYTQLLTHFHAQNSADSKF